MYSSRKTIFSASLSLCLIAVFIACGKKKSGSNDSGEQTFAVSGQLAVTSNLEFAASAPNVVYAIPASVIENIYSFDKSMLTSFPIAADGRFTADVKVRNNDTLLVAVDSTAANRLDGIRGVLSLKDDSGSLMKIPVGEGNGSLDMGTMNTERTGEYTSSKSTSEVAGSFSLDVSKMKEIAKTDDSARGLINVVANINQNGDYIFAKPYMVFKSNIQKIRNVASTSTDLTYNGFGLYFIAKWPGLTVESLCGGQSATNKIRLLPPAGTKLKLCAENVNDGSKCREYDDVTNAKTKSLESEGSSRSSCTSDMTGQDIAADDGNFYVAKEADMNGMTRPLNFNWGGGGYSGTLTTGVWVLKLNDTEVGRYDLAAANPLNAKSKATVYVPSVKAVLDGSNKVTSVQVEWFLWNSGTQTYENVSNLETFSRVVSDASVEIANYQNTRPCGSKSLNQRLSTSGSVMSADVSSFGATFPESNYDSSAASGCQAESIAVGYSLNGVTYRFDFRPFYPLN